MERERERERGREEREDMKLGEGMEFDEDEYNEEIEIPVHRLVPVGYDSPGNPGRPSGSAAVGEGGASAASASVRYRECLKNHAVGIGGSAFDGCGEFMAAGEEGTLDALKCAACNCHRDFHRKETDAGDGGGALVSYHHPHHHPGQQHPQFSPYYRAAPPPAGAWESQPTLETYASLLLISPEKVGI